MKQITYQEAIELMAFAGREDILFGLLEPAHNEEISVLHEIANCGALFFVKEASEPQDKDKPEMIDVPVPGASGETVRLIKEKKPPIDDGKIMALSRAGWSVAKIADEMGVTSNTIYNHIKKMEEKGHVNEDK